MPPTLLLMRWNEGIENLVACMPKQEGKRNCMKTIYYNGLVYTGELPLVEAFVVEDGRFLFTGDGQAAKAMAEEGDFLIDLQGQFVCSGFHDSHMHLLSYGNLLNGAQLAHRTQSLRDMIQCLREYKEAYVASGDSRALQNSGKSGSRVRPGDIWVMGRGWNQDYFTDVQRMPDCFDLDQVSMELPVCAVRACGHCLVVNSKALEILKVTGKTSQLEGGRIGMENGRPDGRFYDNAMDMVYDALPAPGKERLKAMVLASCKALNACGITSCQTDDYIAFRNVSWRDVNRVYKELEQSGQLTVRVYEQCNFSNVEEFKGFVEDGNQTGTGSDMFRIGPLKIVADGALGARTAYLSRAYADDPDTCGFPLYSQEVLEEMVSYANRQGIQVAIHAIGDACLDMVLQAYEKALKEYPRTNHRHGIVHCQITRPDQRKRIADLGLHVYAQGIFLDYDSRIVENRVGKELASTSYSWKTLMRDGVTVSNGSDCPVEFPDVLKGIQCTVTRMPLCGDALPYLPEEGFTVQEALDSYTIYGAKASFEEEKKGRICPGMLADFVVLDGNPLQTDKDKIKDIPVRATYLGGRKVFEKLG